MNLATEILVIILSVFLAVFLVVGIILAIYLIKLTRDIRRVTESAERTVGHIESVVAGASKIASPLFVVELINRYMKKFKKTKKEK